MARYTYFVNVGERELKTQFTDEEKKQITEDFMWKQIDAAGGAEYTHGVYATNDLQKALDIYEYEKAHLIWNEYTVAGRMKRTLVSFVDLEKWIYDDDGDEDDYITIYSAVAMPR